MLRRGAAMLLALPLLAGAEDVCGGEACEGEEASMMQMKFTATATGTEALKAKASPVAPVLSEATHKCIEDSFMAMQVPEVLAKLRGQDQDSATSCGAVPGEGFLRGFQGPDYKPAAHTAAQNAGWFSLVDNATVKVRSMMAPLKGVVGWKWLGKTLKECKQTGAGGECEERHLTNTIRWSFIVSWEAESYNGQWTVKPESWLDGQPAAQILYPKDMPQAVDELRPWCSCGVRTWLGILLWKENGTIKPLRSFLLLPTDAADGDCPAEKTAASMCV